MQCRRLDSPKQLKHNKGHTNPNVNVAIQKFCKQISSLKLQKKLKIPKKIANLKFSAQTRVPSNPDPSHQGIYNLLDGT